MLKINGKAFVIGGIGGSVGQAIWNRVLELRSPDDFVITMDDLGSVGLFHEWPDILICPAVAHSLPQNHDGLFFCSPKRIEEEVARVEREWRLKRMPSLNLWGADGVPLFRSLKPLDPMPLTRVIAVTSVLREYGLEHIYCIPRNGGEYNAFRFLGDTLLRRATDGRVSVQVESVPLESAVA